MSTTAPRRLGIAIIGVGNAAIPHAKSLADLSDDIEVIGFASRTRQKLDAFAASFPFPVTTDIDGLIGSSRVDAVIILTPPASHLELALKSFAAGKHVLAEKPLGLTVAHAEQIVAAGKAAGRKLGVVLQHRFRPGARRLRDLLDAESLGDVAFSAASVPWWRPQSYYDVPGNGTLAHQGGGVLLSQAIHVIDLYRSLVGISAVVSAVTNTTKLHKMETEDFAAALIRSGNGAPGVLRATTAEYPGYAESIEISGTLGGARLIGGNLDVHWLDGRSETIAAAGKTGGGANIMDFPHDWHRDLIADFVDSIRHDRSPMVSGEEALETQRLIDLLAAPH